MIILTVMQLGFGAVNSVIGMASGFIIGKNPAFTAVVMIALNLLSLIFVCVLCEIILKKFAVKISDESINDTEIILPLMMIFFVGIYVNHIFYGDTVSVEKLGMIFRQSPIMLTLQTLGIAAVLCMMRMREKFIGKADEAECARLRAENAERRFENTKAFRHDVKNHMLALRGFLFCGDVKGAEKYLAETEKIGAEFSQSFKSGNPTADIILEKKLSEAEKAGVRILCEIKIPRFGISGPDLCVILANAVDNAVHACERLGEDTEKFIEIRGGIQGDIMLIEIKNSFDGGCFKKGIGLKNIESAADKYKGSVKISCNENVFELRILMNISQH